MNQQEREEFFSNETIKIDKIDFKSHINLVSNNNSSIVIPKSTFPFDVALNYLRFHRPVKRKSWENNHVLTFFPFFSYEGDSKEWIVECEIIRHEELGEIMKNTNPICLWTPTQEDILANDWELVEKELNENEYA